MTLNRNIRSIFAFGLVALTLVPFSIAKAQLAPPQPLGGPPIIIGNDQVIYDFEIAASKPKSDLFAEDREVRGGQSVQMKVLLRDRKTGRPLAGQRIYASIHNRAHSETGFTNGQALGEAFTNGRGEAYFVINTRRVTRVRNVRVKFQFYETRSYKGAWDICSLVVRP